MKIEILNDYNNHFDIILFNGDCSALLNKIPDNSINLIITSPPYNIGKQYEKRISLESYLSEQKNVIEKLYRVLSHTGNICWQVGNYVKDGEVFPLDIYFYDIFKQLGLQLRNRIIWRFGHGLHCSKRFSGRYETILWFSKSNDYVFNLDPVRIPSKYPEKRHYKGKNKGKLSGNPLGKNPSDVWDIVLQDWENEVWDIPNVKSNHIEKTEHPCQFPVELVQRCILALSKPNGVILDPYCGVGSTIIASLCHNRKVIASEINDKYIEITNDRIDKFLNGELSIRPIGKPIHQPKR